MLGKGRPFVYELIDPKRAVDFSLLEAKTVGEVSVEEYTAVDKEFFETIKEMSENKAKRYMAVVQFKQGLTDENIKKLNDLREIELSQ